MSDEVKAPGRRYHAPQRTAQAAATRHVVLEAARGLFVARGYAATTVADIAAEAGVAVDTVYAAVGRKPVLLRELVETALSGTDEVVPAQQRAYVAAIGEARSAEGKLEIYAGAIVAIHQRLAPVFVALRDAAATDPGCTRLWGEIAQRRAQNMGEFAAELRATGQLRGDLPDGDIADVIWSMNAVEYWMLLVHDRGWTPERFQAWLADAWKRLLLDVASVDEGS